MVYNNIVVEEARGTGNYGSGLHVLERLRILQGPSELI